MGLRPIVTPDAVVTHEVGVSSKAHGDKLILLSRGKATLLRKHWHGLRLRAGLFLLAAGAGLRALLGFARGRWGGSGSDVARGLAGTAPLAGRLPRGPRGPAARPGATRDDLSGSA